MNRQPYGLELIVPQLNEYLVDRNGDGIPDDLTIRIVVGVEVDRAKRSFWTKLCDLTARLALEADALPLPIVYAQSAIANVPAGIEPLYVATEADLDALVWDFGGESVKSQLGNQKRSTCLTGLFAVGGMLEDRDGDLLPDATGVGFDIPKLLAPNVGVGLANLAGRIGLESGGLTLPLVSERGRPFQIRVADEPARIELQDDGWLATGAAPELGTLLNRIAIAWPYLSEPETAGASASLAWLQRRLAGRTEGTQRPGDVIWEMQWSARWEVDRILDAYHSQIHGQLDPTLPLTLTVFASEPFSQRKQLRETLLHNLVAAGFQQPVVHVLSSFKAGLSWLTEIVIPDLRGVELASIEITYQRYAHDGGPGEALDLPIRWLQELFPADEILKRELGLPDDRIRFIEDTNGTGPTFRAQAYDTEQRLVGRWECAPLYRRQPFIRQFPDEGNVCVTTGGFIIEQGAATRKIAIDTDLDRFWSFWQGEVERRIMLDIESAGGPHADQQPFFGELSADLTISEANARLDIREENDSAAEALHEDIYFNTLDMLEVYGQRTTGERISAPGAIVPTIHVVPGATPHARVQMRATGAISRAPLPDVRVRALRLEDTELIAEINVEAEPRFSASVADQLHALATNTKRKIAGLPARIFFGTDQFEAILPLPEQLDGGNQRETAPPMDQNIHGGAVLAEAHRLAAFPEMTSWVEARSYEGRPIVGMALMSSTIGRFAPPLKRSIFKPTALIVARHHANEISSTNAAFQLAYLCATDAEWRRLLERLNILLIPYENADGAALHARLASDPAVETWKHHPARYNAAGYEFSEDFFNPATRFGESRVRPAIWGRWLPDVIVDNHGVPSHEWVQPFAGFGSPPRFRVSYWIPQALIYGIIRHVDDPEYPEHARAATALRNAVSTAIRDTDIGELNREYGASYRLWGQSREPERFPGTFHDAMLWHLASGPVDPEGRGFHVRYPRTTVLSWVTEVNDETAMGAHLERVARAHLLANRAMLDLLVASAPNIKRWTSLDEDGRTTLRIGRDRPLKLDPTAIRCSESSAHTKTG